jgi:predicted dehydrogenase
MPPDFAQEDVKAGGTLGGQMAESKLRVGIIGLGAYAITEHIPSLRSTGRAEVVAASRRNADKLALAKRELGIAATYTDWRAMLANEALDAVIVTTPHNQHVEPTLAALERGLHVLVEKPLATTVAEAQAILQAARRSDRVVMIGENLRGHISWRTAHQLLRSGQIGRLRQLNVTSFSDLRIFREAIPIAPAALQSIESSSETVRTFLLDIAKEGAWRRDPLQMGGDMLADVGSHLIDLLLYLGGASVVEVVAYAPKDRPPQAAIFSVQALLSSDVILTLNFNDHVAMGDEFSFRGSGKLTVLGDNGSLVANIPGFGVGPAEEMFIEPNGDRRAVTFEGEDIHPAAAFVAAVCDGAPNISPVDDAVQVVAFIQAAYLSAAERRIVRLDELQ